MSVSSKQYYIANREKVIKRSVEWGRKNKEKRKAIKDKWRSNNKEKTNFLTRQYIYRRKNSQGKISFEDEKYIYKSFPLCPYCNTNKSDTLDHVIPLSQGGTNNRDNLIACCRSCNSKKRDKSLFEFNPILYMMWNRMRV